jgi:hypothetical protein
MRSRRRKMIRRSRSNLHKGSRVKVKNEYQLLKPLINKSIYHNFLETINLNVFLLFQIIVVIYIIILVGN